MSLPGRRVAEETGWARSGEGTGVQLAPPAAVAEAAAAARWAERRPSRPESSDLLRCCVAARATEGRRPPVGAAPRPLRSPSEGGEAGECESGNYGEVGLK